MIVNHFSDAGVAEHVKALYRASRAIPFFGTGFTRNCAAKNGKVPDANALAEVITKNASMKPGLSAKDVADILGMTSLKSAFSLLTSKTPYIPRKERQALLANLFSDVRLGNAHKEAILELEWPHIFSFNIDDAIERSTRRYRVLAPNKPVSREYIAANNCLFKIHGDISEFIQIDDPNVIFTGLQYAKSVKTNVAMLKFLEEQLEHTSIFFIGCSLDTEFDLMYIGDSPQFKNSIYFKRGPLSIEENLRIEEYGIGQVITFDTYEQIYEWLYETLQDEKCAAPHTTVSVVEVIKDKAEGIEIIANGGPLIFEDPRIGRVARRLDLFPKRDELTPALSSLRTKQFLFVTGRRFSGKTAYLLQLFGELTHLTNYFYASVDVFNAEVKRLVAGVESSAFFFDSNYLNVESLRSLLTLNIHHTNRIIICAGYGDAEILRYTLEEKNVQYSEVKVSNTLNAAEEKYFNTQLTKYVLPRYEAGETLLNLAYRYYDSYKSTLSASAMFGSTFTSADFKIFALILAFGKASETLLGSIHPYFDYPAFVKKFERLAEVDLDASGAQILVCNSSSWLIARVAEFISSNTGDAISAVSEIITSLMEDGFQTSVYGLITFNKLNELCGQSRANDTFIRGIFEKIEPAFQSNEHYWLQRAKCELIVGRKAEAIRDGIRFAMPLHMSNRKTKNSTYYSATLVLAHLYARLYSFEPSVDVLIDVLQYYLISIQNYDNNRRHIDKAIQAYRDKTGYLRNAIHSLELASDVKLLPKLKEIQELVQFFKVRSA